MVKHLVSIRLQYSGLLEHSSHFGQDGSRWDQSDQTAVDVSEAESQAINHPSSYYSQLENWRELSQCVRQVVDLISNSPQLMDSINVQDSSDILGRERDEVTDMCLLGSMIGVKFSTNL